MAGKQKETKRYSKQSAKDRLDLILSNYRNFEKIIESYRDGIVFLVSNEKAYNRKARIGEMGVRVQNSGLFSDPTAEQAMEYVEIEQGIDEMILSEDFFKDVEDKDLILDRIWELNLMRSEYAELCKQLEHLETEETYIFTAFMKKKKSYSELGKEFAIEPNSIKQRLYRIRKQLTNMMLLNMRDYPVDEGRNCK